MTTEFFPVDPAFFFGLAPRSADAGTAAGGPLPGGTTTDCLEGSRYRCF